MSEPRPPTDPPAPNADAKWNLISGNYNAFAGRTLGLNNEVYKSESETNTRYRAITTLLQAYEVVNVRDGNQCRVTGRFLHPGAVDARVRREHHHLQARSIAPGRVCDPRNIILVAAEAHQLITGGFIEVEGRDATKPIFFHWNESAMKGRVKPFRIVGKRTAA